MARKIKYSFKQWCEKNNRQDLLDRWDYQLNKFSPNEVAKRDAVDIYLRCARGIHDSQQYNFRSATKNTKASCKLCNSFAQHIIDKHGEEYLNYIWSDKNDKSPWEYQKGTKDKAWFICVDNPEHEYKQSVVNRANDCQCTICNNRLSTTGIAKERSVGYLYPESIDVWSDKNDKTPFDYTPSTDKYVWWKCENGIHDDFQRMVRNSTAYNFKCAECAKEKRVWPKGPDHPNWKGTTSDEILARSGKEGKDWKKSVFKRDGFLCQICLDQTHDRLNAHHIYDFANYPELRYDIRNGITLCEQCHLNHYEGSLHSTYGNANVTPEQLVEYANKRRAELGITELFNIYDYMTPGFTPTPSSIPFPEELPPDLDPVTSVA